MSSLVSTALGAHLEHRGGSAGGGVLACTDLRFSVSVFSAGIVAQAESAHRLPAVTTNLDRAPRIPSARAS